MKIDDMSYSDQLQYLGELISESIIPDFPSPLELIDTCYQLAKEDPDRTAKCAYVDGKNPSCIIGTALNKQYGWSTEQLQMLGASNVENLYDLYIEMAGEFRVQFEDNDSSRNRKNLQMVMFVLGRVQEDQDKGWPWSRVMAEAILNFEELWGEDPAFVDKVLLGIFNYESFSGKHRWKDKMYLYKMFKTEDDNG